MSLNSYHIFYFPFCWSVKSDEGKILSEQIYLRHIPVSEFSQWERVQLDEHDHTPPLSGKELDEARELFGERQYYFNFVHPVLYDIKGAENPLINHYERREPKSGGVSYIIRLKDRTYTLKVDAINLNLYSTGVGILSFYLANESEDQKTESAVRDINQFGRRIMPPHSAEFGHDRRMIASAISIKGLDSSVGQYEDCFDYKLQATGNDRGLFSVWKPASFIEQLISDLSPELVVTPVMDDRMFVNCWYGNKTLSSQVRENASEVKSDFIRGNFWYKYVFVDNGTDLSDDTCQNDMMKEMLLDKSTYFRWQKWGTLYGISRYSFVSLTDDSDFSVNVLSMHMRTIYSRMCELIIIQRASMLRFSAEVTKVSALSGKDRYEVARRISSLYKEYIRFVNQIYFRSVTLQDQGIELYEMLKSQFASDDQIKDLDGEIEELHRYVMLLVDQNRNENSEKLNRIAAIFLPATVVAGILGMNRYCELEARADFWVHVGLIAVITVLIYKLIIKSERK